MSLRYSLLRAAITKENKLGDLKNRDLLSPSSGGQKSQIRLSVGNVSSEDPKGEFFLLPVSGELGCSLICDSITSISACFYKAIFFLCVCVFKSCVYVCVYMCICIGMNMYIC